MVHTCGLQTNIYIYIYIYYSSSSSKRLNSFLKGDTTSKCNEL